MNVSKNTKTSRTYFFILGRNPALSREELYSYFDARSLGYTELLFEKNILLIEFDEDVLLKISDFGGVLQFGEISFNGTFDAFEAYLEGREIIPSDKFTFQVFGNAEIHSITEKFKRERKKAMLKHGRKQIVFQDGHKDSIAHTDFSLCLYRHDSTLFFGVASQEYDSKGASYRDMNKPVRRESLAISPRLATILINLSEALSYETLLDPFCGVGGILQEALLRHIHVYGIDTDKRAIEDAKKNLGWLKKEYGFEEGYTLVQKNARSAPDNQFSAVATETPLGVLLRKKPNRDESLKIIHTFESFIIPILSHIKNIKKPSAKIAITFPVIRDFHVDVNAVTEKTSLKIHKGPFLESRPDQFISRDIIVFE